MSILSLCSLIVYRKLLIPCVNYLICNKKIIFYNGGVLLVDKNQSHVLEELKVLQENGVEIMSCGACIDYYKVDLAIGSTSNMYFIVEEMRAADRVVRP